MNLYIKDGKIVDPRRGVDKGDGTILYNGSVEQMAELGYEVYVPTPYEESQASVISNKIEMLKEQLFAGDYKIIKCYEAQLMDREMPYDINLLIQERDAWRASINEYEEQLRGLEEN